MTHKSTWKAAERKVARIFRTSRRPYSGAADSYGKDDIIHDKAFVEVRLRKSFQPVRWWRKEVEPEAKEAGKLPVLVLFQKGDGQPFVLCPLDADYLRNLWELIGTPDVILAKDDESCG